MSDPGAEVPLKKPSDEPPQWLAELGAALGKGLRPPDESPTVKTLKIFIPALSAVAVFVAVMSLFVSSLRELQAAQQSNATALATAGTELRHLSEGQSESKVILKELNTKLDSISKQLSTTQASVDAHAAAHLPKDK
jgi:hypothetical protein